MWSRSWVIRARLVWGRRGASAASTIYTRDAVSSVIDTRPARRDTRGPPSRLCLRRYVCEDRARTDIRLPHFGHT